eukprot:202393_1
MMCIPWHVFLLYLFQLSTHVWSANYIIGADMSYVDKEDCNGSCSPFKVSANSPSEDSLKMLKDYGFTTIRMRIWNNPSPSNDYCNLQGALFMANRTFKAGLKYHLDFHYSDTWADPGHQTKPAAWSNLYGNALVNAVYNYTFNVLSALKKQGTTPQSVQIGNEIDGGMLWAPSGQPCDHGGYILDPCQDNWSYFAQLVGAGVKATRDVDTSIEIMIHTSLGNRLASGSSAVNYIETWYSKLYNTYNVKFDSIGLSFYPGWCKCDLQQVNLLSNLMNSFKGCSGGLYLAETSYPYNPNITYDWSSTYPFTPQGQLEYVQALMGIVESNKIKGLKGFMWWGTEYYNVVQNDVNAPLWDWHAVALPALLKGFK